MTGLTRVQRRRRLRRLRNRVAMVAASGVLTLGTVAVLIFMLTQQRPWSLAWVGAWVLVIHQLAAFAGHVYSLLRLHGAVIAMTEGSRQEETR